jgi:Putative peptidoglycan binding domain
MSTRFDDGAPRGHADEDDDWFAGDQEPRPVVRQETSWDDEPEWEPAYHEDPVRRDLAPRQIGILIAVAVALFLVIGGFLVGRATEGSKTTTVTESVTLTETTTTPTKTTPATTTTTPTTPTSADAVPTGETLRPGMTGSSVTALQTALTALGYSPGAADGSYGASTTAAVSAFQAANDLTADGIAGPATLTAINAALASG